MLSKQIALVTGASRGLGRGIAVKLAEAGATVYATALSAEKEESQWLEPFTNKFVNVEPKSRVFHRYH